MKSTIFSVTFRAYDSSFNAKYRVIDDSIDLISISTMSGVVWGGPQLIWGYADMLKPHVVERWQKNGKPEHFTFDTQWWDTKEFIGTN